MLSPSELVVTPVIPTLTPTWWHHPILTKTAFRSPSDCAKNLWPNFNWWLAPSLKALVQWCKVPEMGIHFPRKQAIWGAWPIPILNQQACRPTPTTHKCRYLVWSRPLYLLYKALMQRVAHHQKATLIGTLKMPIRMSDNCPKTSLRFSLWHH